MNRALEAAIDKIKALPEDRQRFAAEVLERIVLAPDQVYVLTEEEERLIQECLDDPSPPATEAQVRAVFDKYR